MKRTRNRLTQTLQTKEPLEETGNGFWTQRHHETPNLRILFNQTQTTTAESKEKNDSVMVVEGCTVRCVTRLSIVMVCSWVCVGYGCTGTNQVLDCCGHRSCLACVCSVCAGIVFNIISTLDRMVLSDSDCCLDRLELRLDNVDASTWPHSFLLVVLLVLVVLRAAVQPCFLVSDSFFVFHVVLEAADKDFLDSLTGFWFAEFLARGGALGLNLER